MKTYQIADLQKKLNKHIKMAEAIKSAMNREGIPAWSKNNLIKEYNLNVRVIKSIREKLLAAL
jgi:hypothetical protein